MAALRRRGEEGRSKGDIWGESHMELGADTQFVRFSFT